MLLRGLRSSSRVAALLFLLAGLGEAVLQGQPAYLVRDIHPAPGAGAFIWNDLIPREWAEHEGILLFGADDGTSGAELWRSDGTAEGTFLVKDLNPGADSLALAWMTPWDGSIVFSARGTLWQTDGTPEGTSIFTSDFGRPEYLTSWNGSIYFSAYTGETATELWKSDGTDIGTALVKDIWPGGDDGDFHNGPPQGSEPRELTVSGGTLFFTAAHDGGIPTLWKTDGTENGTLRVKTPPPGSFGYFSEKLVDYQGTLLFTNRDPDLGFELWRSDGTEAGTVLVKDIWPGSGSSMPLGPPPVVLPGGPAFFAASDGVTGLELWKSDGTEAGTVRVKDISPGAADSHPQGLIVMDGRVYFWAEDGVHGRELWGSDGTEEGTRLVEDLFPGPGSSQHSLPLPLYAEGSVLVFTASDGVHGHEPWRSDGTALGTRMLQDIAAGSGSSTPQLFQPAGSKLFFHANDGVHGRELWALPKTALLSTFADVPASHPAWQSVEALVDAGLTAGCGGDLYCPWENVNRAQMAVFLVRGIHGAGFAPPPATGTLFEDVPAGHWAASWIEQLVADGITSGCSAAPARFCPDRPLTRAEMAILLLRAKHGSTYTPPPATGTVFTDVPASHWAGAWIEQLAAEGVTLGCAPGLYCPGNPVNRGQMAIFLTRTFSLPLP